MTENQEKLQQNNYKLYISVFGRHGNGQSSEFPYTAHNKLLNKMGKVRMKGDWWEGQRSLADLINYCILKCLFTEVSSYKRSDVN